jgi:hypothetical protein
MSPELASVEAFVDYLLADDRTEATYEEADELAAALGQSVPTLVIRKLVAAGVTVGARPMARRVRGFQTSSNDRYFGPGSSPSHGGSGWEQINGFAGRQG